MKLNTFYLLCLVSLSTAAMPLAQAEDNQTAAAPTQKKTGVCFCLHHKALRTLIKNCEWNQRPNEPEPHLFCMGEEGKDNTPKKLKNWEELPADHQDCKPCDEVKQPKPGSGPIRGD